MASPEFEGLYAALLQGREEALASGAMPEIDGINELMNGIYDTEAPSWAQVQPVDAGGVSCEWVCHPGADPARRMLYLHGGGYVAGTLDHYRAFAAHLSEACGAAVLNVDYRMGPAHKFPAAVDDALAAYRYMLGNGPAGAGNADSAVVAGDSAGGGLALALLLALKDSGDAQPAAAVPMSPWTDLTESGSSYDTRGEADPMISRELLQWMASFYAPESELKNPLASPLFGDPSGLPPLYILVGERETMFDDARGFADKAEAAGVDVTFEEGPEMVHVWPVFGPAVPESAQAIARIGAFVKNHT